MKFRYLETQEPARDERSWVIGMTVAGINIDDVDLHFDIHKTTAYQIINRIGKTMLAGDHPRSGRLKKNGSFHSYQIFFQQTRFAERLGTVSAETVRNRLRCS